MSDDWEPTFSSDDWANRRPYVAQRTGVDRATRRAPRHRPTAHDRTQSITRRDPQQRGTAIREHQPDTCSARPGSLAKTPRRTPNANLNAPHTQQRSIVEEERDLEASTGGPLLSGLRRTPQVGIGCRPPGGTLAVSLPLRAHAGIPARRTGSEPGGPADRLPARGRADARQASPPWVSLFLRSLRENTASWRYYPTVCPACTNTVVFSLQVCPETLLARQLHALPGLRTGDQRVRATLAEPPRACDQRRPLGAPFPAVQRLRDCVFRPYVDAA